VTEHESVRELLTLAAAGVLSAEEHRRVEQHAATCDLCRRELEGWQTYSRELGRLPAPAVPAHLAERTRTRIVNARKATAEHRWSGVVLTVLALYAWTIALVSWVVWRIFTGDAMSLFETGFVRVLIWSGASTAFAWVTAAVAAVVLGFQRHAARRIL
jgi:anti-sigma factor RsiW